MCSCSPWACGERASGCELGRNMAAGDQGRGVLQGWRGILWLVWSFWPVFLHRGGCGLLRGMAGHGHQLASIQKKTHRYLKSAVPDGLPMRPGVHVTIVLQASICSSAALDCSAPLVPLTSLLSELFSSISCLFSPFLTLSPYFWPNIDLLLEEQKESWPLMSPGSNLQRSSCSLEVHGSSELTIGGRS